jgi:hypothetical protein
MTRRDGWRFQLNVQAVMLTVIAEVDDAVTKNQSANEQSCAPRLWRRLVSLKQAEANISHSCSWRPSWYV